MNLREIVIALDGDAKVAMRYRDGTKDLHTIRENWGSHPYSLRRHSGIGFLEETYSRLLVDGRTPLIIDAGANIGASALYFAWRYPLARIVAVEPEPETFALLQENTAPSPQVRAIQAAIGSSAGQALLLDPGRSTDAYRVRARSGAGETSMGSVEMVTVTSLLKRYEDATPFLVKVDIEGGEGDLFSGDVSWMRRFPAVAIELHDWLFPGAGTSVPFLRASIDQGRDIITPSGTEIVFSIDRLTNSGGTSPSQ